MGNLVQIFQVLPVQSSPGGSIAALLNFDGGHVFRHLAAFPGFFDIAGAGLGLHAVVAFGVAPVTHGQLHPVGVLQLRVVEQQGVNGFRGGLGGGPVLRLFLLEQPQLHLFHSLLVLGDGVERLNQQGLPFNGGFVPEIAVALFLP